MTLWPNVLFFGIYYAIAKKSLLNYLLTKRFPNKADHMVGCCLELIISNDVAFSQTCPEYSVFIYVGIRQRLFNIIKSTQPKIIDCLELFHDLFPFLLTGQK